MQRKLLGYPQYVPLNSQDSTLGFESRFDSGNLKYAIKTGKYDYDLFISEDVGNAQKSNWFFFKIYNTRRDQLYTFSICNLNKKDNMFNHGMKVLCFSEKQRRYFRLNQRSFYYCNDLILPFKKNCRTLHFEALFPEDDDSVFLMLNYCYPYARGLNLYSHLTSQPQLLQNFERRLLCKTGLGNSCHYYVITNK